MHMLSPAVSHRFTEKLKFTNLTNPSKSRFILKVGFSEGFEFASFARGVHRIRYMLREPGLLTMA